MNESKSHIKDLGEAGLLSAIWILASKSEIPFITYRNVINRFGLPESYDVRSLIKTRRDLFRSGIPEDSLLEWKKEMLRRLEAGQYGSIPAWVFESDDPLDRRKAIESIRTDDVFKSQFRSPKSSLKSGPSPIEVIDWGLEHLERLRRAEEERKESQWKWFKEGLIPILSVIVALGTVIITFYFQYQNIQAQKEMKEYEVSFKPKQETYTSFVKAASAAFEYAFYGDKGNLQKSLSSMETNLFVMESLIKSDSGKLRLWKEYHEYHEYLRNLSQIKSEDINEQNYLKSFEEHRNLFGKLKEDVYQELFQGD